MRYLSLTVLAVAGLTACAPHRPPAPPAPGLATSCRPIPRALNGYTLTETLPYGDSAQGTGYRFAGSPDERVTVFVYPIAADVRAGGDAQAWATAEGKKFEGIFPIGVQRGWYQSYRFVFANPEPVTVEGRNVPGFIAGAVTKNREQMAVELEYVYVVCDRFLKVRATLDTRTWTDSKVPTFAKALAAQLAAQ